MMHTALSTPASGRRAARALRAAALSLALGAASAAHAAPLKIGMTFQELNNPYFVTMQKALDEAAASIGAKAEIYQLMRELSARGYSIVLISSELPEIVGLCDRVAVFRQGRIEAMLEGEAIEPNTVMTYATSDVRGANHEHA